MKKSELKKLVKEEFEDFIKKNNEEETEVMDAENQPEEVEAEEESPIKGDLQAIADAAGKAVAAFKGDEELEDWVKSHIAAAKELITHAADFLGSDEDAEEGAEEIEDNENVVNEDKKASAKKGSKPDFLDLDKDGDKKEPMKKAAKEGDKKEELAEGEEVKEEPKKDVKVKKVDAQKVKDFAKEMSTKGEHTQVLKMIKKLETYVKTHINKEEDSK